MAPILADAAMINIGDRIQQTASISVIGQNITIQHASIGSGTFSVGMFKFAFKNVTQNKNYQIGTFCTDIGAGVGGLGQGYLAQDFGNSTTDGVKPPWVNTPESIENAAWIYNNKYQATFDYPAGTQPVPNAQSAAALQLAIWEVLYESPAVGTAPYTPNMFTVAAGSGGNFRTTLGATHATVVQANSFLNDLVAARNNPNWTAYDSTWLRPVGSDWKTETVKQGLLFDDVVVPVPEPTTVLAAAFLLLPFGLSTLRTLRRKEIA